MYRLNKLNLLDKCIDGSIDNMNELLDMAFEPFDTMYRICRDEIGDNNIVGVVYRGLRDNQATFDVSCSDVVEYKLNDFGEHINVSRTDDCISLNISLREE